MKKKKKNQGQLPIAGHSSGLELPLGGGFTKKRGLFFEMGVS